MQPHLHACVCRFSLDPLLQQFRWDQTIIAHTRQMEPVPVCVLLGSSLPACLYDSKEDVMPIHFPMQLCLFLFFFVNKHECVCFLHNTKCVVSAGECVSAVH